VTERIIRELPGLGYMGAFVQAWLRVRRNAASNRQLAATHFVQPLLDHMQTAGRGHVSEIADGDFPYRI